ncbi:hypothetical protein [Maribacter sp. 1_2014MBL_MicDiv]|uniref:hypothetical protein n=1 Tax=Maribacter sp. 1_2014MBL_MicDiv TaxID=1644130 RepID=UPI0008F53DA7|nr:hypothetical protein [Maribacter sp. 1_2014MBL_MicDiv]APA63065.1 hypothetical protein YQ22_01140 [Maribacter sp. 1_2014MBL_MicDiv]
MIQFFLRLKQWQLFIVMLGLPIIYQLFFIFEIFGSRIQPMEVVGEEGVTQVLNERYFHFDFLPYVLILFSLVFFGWFWSIAIGLQKNIPVEIEMKVKRFKAFFIIPLVYTIVFMMFIGGLFSGMFTYGFSNSTWFLVIILPLHLFSMFCIFHTIYFVAKTIRTAELQRVVTFGDFAGEFFLLWFYIIGIWIIQPKVNRLNRE